MAYSTILRDVCLGLALLRRTRFAVTLLLVSITLLAVAETGLLPTSVHAAFGVLKLKPTKGPTGIEVSFNGTLSGFPTTCVVAGYSTTATLTTSATVTSASVVQQGACAIQNIPPPAATTTLATAISTSTTVVLTNFTGSFTVGPVSPGQYVIRVTGSGGVSNDFVEAIFNVTAGPVIRLFPKFGPDGTHAFFNGTGFSFTDTSCVVGAPSSAAILGGTQACVIRAGSGIVNGSFTIGNVLPGHYVIQVCGSPLGDFAQAIFNVTFGPVIRLFPSSGRIGIHVAFNGTGFLPTDVTCAVGAPGSGAVLGGTQACVTIV
jgi:hypothetical protein